MPVLHLVRMSKFFLFLETAPDICTARPVYAADFFHPFKNVNYLKFLMSASKQVRMSQFFLFNETAPGTCAAHPIYAAKGRGALETLGSFGKPD